MGRYGESILVYKFRTLLPPKRANINSKKLSALRYSNFGGLLRRMRIDEIPQLLNVLAGEMSLIGPRPLLAEEQPINSSIRLSVRPGITGWAQVNGGELLTPEQKNILDIWYVYNSSFYLDILILCKTILALIYGAKINQETIKKAESWINQNILDATDLHT